MNEPVLTKRDFARRYAAGEFGNTSPTWLTLDEFMKYLEDDPLPGNRNRRRVSRSQRYHLRSKVAGGPTHYNLQWDGCLIKWENMPDHSAWYCSAMAPEHLKVFQGELVVLPGELWLTYNTLPLPMREGMAKGMRHCKNSAALCLLRYFMCANSWDWLNELLDRFTGGPHEYGHAIEFSTYSKPWGTLYPLFNTCFWEVRRY